jgi:hypothetical protein
MLAPSGRQRLHKFQKCWLLLAKTRQVPDILASSVEEVPEMLASSVEEMTSSRNACEDSQNEKCLNLEVVTYQSIQSSFALQSML